MEKDTKGHTKLLLLGDSEVGKTSILYQYCDKTFSYDIKSTFGVDFRLKRVQVDGEYMKLQIWDTAGQERFRSIGKAYYRGSEGIVVVFDLTRWDSFDHVEDWISDIKSTVDKDEFPILLLANKKDLQESRVVDTQSIRTLASQHNIPYYEVSAKTGENIEESITEFAKGIYMAKKEKGELFFKRSDESDVIQPEPTNSKPGSCTC